MRHAIGNKAKGLQFLEGNGFKVPEFHILEGNGINLENVEGIIEGLSLSQGKWAVRSSTAIEDGKEHSFAGQFKTRLNVSNSELSSAILDVQKSITSHSSYRENDDYDILVQVMVEPAYSGVSFSCDPQSQDREMIVEIVPGTCDKLVTGEQKGIQFRCVDHQWVCTNPDMVFEDELSLTASDLQLLAEKKLADLKNGLLRIRELKGFEVDVEFAVAEDTLYWLQIRPITGLQQEGEPTIWDQSNIGDNFPGLTLPISVSLLQRTYYVGYRGLLEAIGMSQKRLEENDIWIKSMSGSIYGAMYYHVTAWQKILYQFPFARKSTRMLTEAWGMEEAELLPPKKRPNLLEHFTISIRIIWAMIRFQHHKVEYQAKCDEVTTEVEQKLKLAESIDDLRDTYIYLESQLGTKWIAPLLNGFFAMTSFALLKQLIVGSNLIEKHPNFINDILYDCGDIVSVRIVRELRDLIKQIHTNEALKECFEEMDPAQIRKDIQAKFPVFNQSVDSYIEKYGIRCESSELKLETENYKENPVRFFELLKRNSTVGFKERPKRVQFGHLALVSKGIRFNPFKRSLVNWLIQIVICRFKDRENYRFLKTEVFHLIRTIFRRMDDQLLVKSVIEKKGDTHYLTIDDLLSSASESGYGKIITKAKEDYQTWEHVSHEQRYKKIGDRYIAGSKQKKSPHKGSVFGSGCSSGIVRDKVIFPKNGNSSKEGGIMVAPYFEPGDIEWFATASGIISERGNLLSHTAILCREMGIPSIVGAKGLMERVKPGDEIVMNGENGEIIILRDE